jgi:DNA-binding GntR family transcriptional regulator
MILSGAYRPGQSLRQEEIANELDVSRAPVREALSLLEREQLVELRPRRGFIVASLGIDEIEEIFHLRMIVEEYAARLATQRRTPADVATLRSLVEAMDRLLLDSPDNIAKWANLNGEFHTAFYRASGQRHLFHITGNLRNAVEQYVRLDTLIAQSRGSAQKDHRDILEAFEAGDAERAARLSRAHCQHTCERLIESLRAKSHG